MEFTGERIIWRDPQKHLKEFRKHINWYMEAMEHAKNRRVIDAACGTGFGSLLLSTVAKEVMAVDIEDMAEQWDPLIGAAPGDLRFGTLDFETEAVDFGGDLTVSIETIEHLANPEFFLEGLRTASLFFTIPCYGDKANKFHKIEYSEESAKELIERFFPHLEYRMENGHMIGIATKNI